MKKSGKKILLAVLISLLGFSSHAVDVQLRIQPFMYIPIGLPLELSGGGTASIDIAHISVRKRDSIFFSAQATYSLMRANGISNLFFLDFGIGAGYEFRLFDRLSLLGEAAVGFWSVPKNEANGFSAAQGYSVSTKLTANVHVLPYLGAGVSVGYRLLGSDCIFMSSFEIGASVRIDLSKALFGKSEIAMTDIELSPIFPVFYSYYYNNGFGKATFVNNEKNKITDVKVSVFIEEFMTNESIVKTFDSIEIGEKFTVDLTAFLNESILNTIMKHPTNATITVSYKNLGHKTSYSETVQLVTLSRNNMSWEDDARAATFVSGKDASASRFARFVQLIMKDRINSRESQNIQYAKAIFAALKAYGINYVIDPSSAFTDNVGSANIDFLQFPYQTLLYHGGDCDDLTILNCSLLEALGIETAFITVPGHIYMAFDSGYTESEIEKLTDKNFIIQNDKVWIPVEITMGQDTFQMAKNMGMIEWNKAGDEAALIPVHGAWEKYNPVSIPDSDVKFELPGKEKVLRNLQ